MPRACERFAYRLILFYVVGILVVCTIVGYNISSLMNAIASGQSNVAASSFVIGIREAGIRVLSHIINASILTSAYSCGTGELYGATQERCTPWPASEMHQRFLQKSTGTVYLTTAPVSYTHLDVYKRQG